MNPLKCLNFTDIDYELLYLAALGYNTQETADIRGVSHQTVKNQRKGLLDKARENADLTLESIDQLVCAGYSLGLFDKENVQREDQSIGLKPSLADFVGSYSETSITEEGFKFTSKEIEVITYIMKGYTTKEICQLMDITENTLKCSHKSNIMQKIRESGKVASTSSFDDMNDSYLIILGHKLGWLYRKEVEELNIPINPAVQKLIAYVKGK